MSTSVFPLTTSPSSTNGTTSHTDVSPDVRGELMRITPEMAADLLKRKLPNRPLSKARVRAMIQDMREGRWVFNGEPIILSEDLSVIDGQHRLQSIYESRVTLQLMVVVGVRPDADVVMSIDQGRAKVGGDMLAMAGLAQAKELASAARWVFRYENRRMRESAIALRNSDLPAFVEARPSLPGSLVWGRLLHDLIPQSCASMLFYLMTKQDAGLAKRFFDALAHGDALKRDRPELVARERLLRDKSPKNHAGVLGRGSLIVLAWNCVRLDRAMPGSLTWKGVADASVPFPEVV